MESNKGALTQTAKEPTGKSVPAEELPLAERVKLAEAAVPFDAVAPGWLIDAKDTVDNWCVANVVKVDNGELVVNYDGWSPKYDTSFKVKSRKICPFRLASRGYTGQVRVPLRKLEFSLSQLADNKKKLEEVIASNFASLSTPHEVTQYLRGKFYIYIDFLLSNEYKDPEKEIVPVAEYLVLVVRLVAIWLGRFPDLLKSFTEWQACPKLILVDRNVALAACGFELLDILKWFFCLCPRTLFFFARYDVNIDPEKAKFTKEFQTVFEKQRDRMASYEVLREKVLMEEETVYGLFANLFNAFCIAGGLQAVDSIVTAEKLNLKAAAAGLVGYKLPLDVIAMVLAPFKSIKAIAKDEVCKEVATVGKTAFFQRVQVLDDKEIKDINKEQIAGAMSLMRGFLKLIHNEEEASKMIQAHEMLISLKFLQSASLEKRLNGLADIKRMIDRVDQLIDRPIPGQDTTGWFNADYLVKWIVQHNILGKILDDNAHAELIRRTSYILTFLARHGAITTEMLELLWKCQQDKHEDLVRAVYDTVKDIVEFLSPENIRFINAKLMAYPLEAYDEKLISFTKDFTLKAYASQSKAEEASLRKKSDDKKAGEPAQVVSEPPPEVTGKIERGPAGEVLVTAAESMYGLPRLWALQQDESPAQQPLIGMATTAFKEIIVSNNSARYRYQYLYLCMENLKNNKSVPQSLALANYIIAIVNAHKLLHKTTVVELITRLAKEYGLVDVVLGSFQHYEKLVVEALGKGLRQENVGEAVIVGKYKHVSNLELRFKFTEHLRRFGEDAAKFGTENVMKLWRLFVDDCSSEFDTQQFLKWLASEKEGNGCMVPLGVFSQDENQILFDTLAKSRVRLGNSPNLSYYRCFSTLFKLLNINSKSGEVRKGRFRTLKFATLSGLDELWENACRCGQEASRAQFCELLIDAYTNLHESVAGQRKDTMAALVDRCMGCVIKAEADKDELTITNIVKLLQQLFDIIDGKRYEDTEETTAHKFQISLVLKPGLETKAAEVGMDVVVGQLRRKAAEAFHLPFSGIQLFTSTRTFDPEEDDQKLRVLGWVQQIYVQKLAGETGNEDPKMYLAQKQEYILSLFSLLSKETSPYVDSVWSLLTTLPANKKMQTDIETLSLPEGVSNAWDSLMDSKSMHKLLYSLQIVEGIMMNCKETKAAQPAKESWIEQFCKKEGLAHLFSALLNLPIVSINNPLTRKCFALLLKVLFIIQASGYPFGKYIRDYETRRERLVERVLLILDSFAKHSILSQAERSLRTPKKAKTAIENPATVTAVPQATGQPELTQKEKKRQAEEANAFSQGFALIRGEKAEAYNYFEQLMKFAGFKPFLLKALVLSDNQKLQQALSEELVGIYKLFMGKEYSPSHAHVVLMPFMLKDMVNETLERETKCQCFYQLVCRMVKETPTEDLQRLPVNFHDQICDLSSRIKERPVKENKSTDTDEVMIGLMNLVEALLKRFPSEKEFVGSTQGLLYEVLHHCLFDFPKSGSRQRSLLSLPPKCKSQGARQAAFSLLSTLASDTPKNLKQVIDYLAPIHVNAAWRTKRMSDWDIVPEAGEKSTTGYVGIKNLGCICYMNALLQQMYMIPSFRDDILSVDDPNKTLTHDDNPLFQTQCLFTALSESVKQYYNPKLFCHAFKDWEGKSINVFEQMDVDEFFSLFLDKLESAVKGTVQEKTVKHHFGGVFANQLLGKDCPHSSVREEPFLALNLQVKNKKSLQQCLESFVEGEMLQGSNAYYCEKCDKKVTALKRVCIKRLPRYMVCVLKRFDINYDTMQKFKINDYCEFPTKLNMEPYTEEGLAKKDREKERAKAKKEGRDIEEPPTQSKVQYPPAYYEYKLTGVVIHIGTADAGHYYSLAMDREKEWLPEKERWYEFNDTLVEHYDPEDIRDDAFGAEEHNNMPGVEGAMKSLGRLRNAYLLVYERAEPYEPPEEEDEAEKAHNKSAKTGLRETEISKTIHEAIMTENIKYWYNKFMFHEDYLEFARRLCLTWNSAENVLTRHPCKNYDYPLLSLKEDLIAKHAFQTEGKEVVVPTNERMEMKGLTLEALRDLDLLVYKYASTILLTTLLRSKSRTLVPDFIDICKAYQNKHVEAARWILWQFTNSKLLYEFLLECHEQEMRSLVVGLLYCAMLKVYERDKTVIAKCSGTETKECTLPNFANCIMQQLAGCRKFTIHFEQFFQLFARMTFLGGEMRDYFLRTGALKRLLGFWATLPDTKWNVFTELPFTENATPELGLPSVVDERFQSFFEEFYTLRREKAYQDAQPAYTFLFEAVSLLLRGTAAAEKSPLALAPETKYADGEFAIATVLKDPKLVSELIKDCRSSVSLNSMSQALVHISWANLELKNELTKGIVANVTEMEWDDLRKSFFFLRALLRAEDKTQKDYIDGALTALFKVMEACKKAYYATYYSIRYVMSLAKTEKAVAEWMAKNAEKWAWLCDWLKENPFPSHELTDVLPFKAKEQNDNSTMRNPGGLSAEEQQTWRSTTESFQKLLVKIKTGETADLDEEIGEYDSLYYEKVLQGQIVEVCDTKTHAWERYVVRRVLDEMLYLQPEGLPEKYSDWTTIDNNMAKEGTHTKGKPEQKDAFSDDSDNPY